MRRNRTIIIRALIGATVVAGSMAVFSSVAQATPVACSENALAAAINTANTSPGPDTLNLASGCTYTMTGPHGDLANALPVITSRIELIGPAVITRSSLLPFRIAEISSTGNLTLTTSVSFTNGSAVGDGGAILNHGALTLTVSSLVGNVATGNGGGVANVGTAPAATFNGSSVTTNAAALSGGGIYNGPGGTMTASGEPMVISGNTAVVNGGGIAAINSTSTTLTNTAVTTNVAVLGGGVYRQGGTMTITTSPISANLANNCVGSSPAVPDCTG